ncbi:MAG: LicD family protein [Clostridia bacterium]|nr:LicD family protein [Clostridia bacterium]
MEIKLENLNYYLTNNLKELIHSKVFENKQIVLFGVNSTSHLMRKILHEHGYSVAAYVDNDRNKCQQMNDFLLHTLPHHINGTIRKESLILAYSPEEYLKNRQTDTIVLIASKYYPQMSAQLQKIGYEPEQQVFRVVDFYALEKLVDQDELTGYRKLEMTEIRNLQMDLMRYVRTVCEKNGLRYYMCGGTLLGAVRHGGYIPWDDDVDIAMPMPDFKRFIEIVKEQKEYLSLNIYDYPDDYYNFFMRLINTDTYMKNWEYPFLMSTGVSIDIFPLFGLPELQKERSYFYQKIRLLNERYISTYIENEENNIELLTIRHELQKQIEDMMEQYPFDECEWIGNVLSKYREKEIMPRTIYQGCVELGFENETFAAAIGYQDYLSRLFGDYMKLPPEQDRMNTHSYHAYMKIE